MGNMYDIVSKATSMGGMEPMYDWIKSIRSSKFKDYRQIYADSTKLSALLEKMLRSTGALYNLQWPEAEKTRTIYSAFFSNNDWFKSIKEISNNERTIHNLFSIAFKATPLFDVGRLINSEGLLGLNNKFALTNAFHSLQLTLGNLSREVSSKGVAELNSELLKKFTATSAEAVEITKAITQNQQATSADIERIEAFIGKSLEDFKGGVIGTINKKSKSTFELVNFWVALLGLIFTLFQIAQSFIPNEKGKNVEITTEQVKQLKEFVDSTFQEALKKVTHEVKIRIDCNLRMKPRSNSRGFYHVRANEIAHVIEANHQWARITVIDPNDKLPVMGWVRKKYLLAL